tara:strand:+ start:1533 stop:1751 length:219 start_codon:yes stop_codon:yes gene_type:complete
LPEEIDVDEILGLYSMYREDSDTMLRIVLFTLQEYPSEIQQELGITSQYRERLQHVAMKMYTPEMPGTEKLN